MSVIIFAIVAMDIGIYLTEIPSGGKKLICSGQKRSLLFNSYLFGPSHKSKYESRVWAEMSYLCPPM